MPSCREQIISQGYADYIIEYAGGAEHIYELYPTQCVQIFNERYAAIHLPVTSMERTVGVLTYHSIPKLYGLMDTTSMDSSGITRIRSQPYLNLSGEDIIVGVVDTGIDYMNPLFRNSDGSSRIIGLWDQTIEPVGAEGRVPSDAPAEDQPTVDYGTAYSQGDINRALEQQNPLEMLPSRDESGHGTFLTGIAAGGEDLSNDFIGAAPRADIAIVKLKAAKNYLREFYLIPEDAEAYQENDIMAGVAYLIALARQANRPLSILIGLGTNSGNHTGSSYLSRYLDAVGSLNGVVITTAAGNESNRGTHFEGMIEKNNNGPVEVELRVGENERGFVTELWSVDPDIFYVGFVSPGGQVIDRIQATTGEQRLIRFYLEPTQIFLYYQIAESSSGGQVVFMRFQAPTPGIWRIRVYGVNNLFGQFHMWLPIQDFISEDTHFLLPQPDTTVTSPGDGSVPLSIGAYNHYNNSIYLYSGRGFTPYGRVVPSLCAPGVNVFGPGLGQRYTTRSGTSVAAAHVCGAAALMLQWGFYRQRTYIMSSLQVKQYFIRGARRMEDITYPSRLWGYGTLDVYYSFEIFIT